MRTSISNINEYHEEKYHLKDKLIFTSAAAADAAMVQTQTVYTEATPEQLEQLQQQGVQYDVVTFSNE